MRNGYWAVGIVLLAAACWGGQSATMPSPADLASMAADRVDDASREANVPNRDRLLDEAVGLYRQAIEATGKAGAMDAKLKNLEYRLMLADTIGLVRCQPYAAGLLFLQGNQEDRRAIVDLTTPLLRDIADLSRDLDDVLMTVRADMKARMLYLDGLQQFRDRMSWQLAGIFLNRGMALAEPNEAAERISRLRQVVDMVRPFAEAETSEFQAAANLRMGEALGEMGTARDREQAAECFAKAGVEAAGGETQMDAKFQAARNRIEQGRYDLAAAAIEDFTATARRLAGPERKVATDVKTTLLTNHLNEARAAAQSDPAKALPFRQAAQKCLVDFTKSYPDPRIIDPFMLVIGSKYRDRTDLDNLGAFVLAAMAKVELAHKSGDGNEAMDKAATLLKEARKREDPVSLEAGPLVLWELAMLSCDRRDFAGAGELFAEVGKTEGTPPALASQALSHAVIAYQRALEEWPGDNASVPRKLRQGYVDAIEQVLGRAGDEPKARGLYFDLGSQHRLLADMSQGEERKQNRLQAVEAFEKVPPESEQYMDARFAAVWTRLAIFEDGDGAQRQQEAKSLSGNLEAFAADVGKAAASAKGARAQSLREWGSRAAFRAMDIRYQYVDHEAALKGVPKVLDDWKGTSIIRDVRAWEIEILVKSTDSSKVAEARRKIEDFQNAYSPQEAEALLRQAVERLAEQIKELHKAQGSARELAEYRKSYLEFATSLYKALVPYDPNDPTVPPATINRDYLTRQTYAQALLEAGQAEAALPVWQECIRIDEAEIRPRQARQVAEEFAGKVAAVRAALAADNAGQLEALGDDFLKDAKDRGLNADDYSQVQAVKKAMEAGVPAEKIKGLEAKLLPAYTWLGNLARDRVANDVVNVWGLAKTYWAIGQYAQARKLYDRLLNGIGPESYPREYWQAAVEMCQCWLEGYKADKKEMAALETFVRGLEIEDETCGGCSRDFEGIVAQARQASK